MIAPDIFKHLCFYFPSYFFHAWPVGVVYSPTEFQAGAKWSEINFTDGVWTHQENQATRRVPLESLCDTLNLIPKEQSAAAIKGEGERERGRERERTFETSYTRMAVNPKILAIKSRLIFSSAGAITLLSLWLSHCTSLFSLYLVLLFVFYLFFFFQRFLFLFVHDPFEIARGWNNPSNGWFARVKFVSLVR